MKKSAVFSILSRFAMVLASLLMFSCSNVEDQLGMQDGNGKGISSPATAATFVVYLKKPATWGNTPRVYYWGGDCGTATWPGQAMTAATEAGTDWYKFTFTGTTTKLIFNNNSSPQTADLTRAKTGYFMNNQWYDTNPEAPITNPLTVYMKKPSAWVNTPYVYYWNGNCGTTTWPGMVMTAAPEAGTGWYKYTFSGTTTSLIFSDKGNSQTADLSRGTNGYFYNNQWYNSNPETPVTTTFTVYCKKPTTWTSTLKVYYWGGDCGTVSWPGATMAAAADAGTGWYKFSFTGTTTKLIFNNNGSPQTADLTRNKTGYYANNTWYDTNPDLIPTTNKLPVANAGNDIYIQPGGTAYFDGSASYDPDGSIVTYAWNNGLTGAEPSKVYSTVGTYTVTLTVTDNKGGKATDKVIVNVNAIPTPSQSIDFREETIYFLMTARFYDGDPDNNRPSRCYVTSGNAANNDPGWRGDFKGLIQKLDYIKAMGFSAVWITPIVLNRSDYDFHGYHTWDFNKVDARLESPGAGYQDLINAAHAKGLKIIQDIVINHTSRYGAVGLQTVKYWGDSADPQWGDGTTIDYYDKPNTSFVYDGKSYEPVSGKNYYNGDLWTKVKPTLSWDALAGWGLPSGYYSPEGYKCYNYQWPNLQLFNPKYFHKDWLKNWEDYTCQIGSIHEDCIDLNTEDADVQQFLIAAYKKYIDMGVDAFRMDTVKHISRWTLTQRFLPAWNNYAKPGFYIFGEVCTRVHEIWNKGVAPLSVPFYTWNERQTFSGTDAQCAQAAYNYECGIGTGNQPTSGNHYLNGNTYHTPDYSKASGMGVIDFHMHWNFSSAGSAFYAATGTDQYFNDATWNVCYVDSHDYGPGTDNRFAGSEADFAEDFSLLWTFRGIPCIYYGSEIQFQKGAPCDKGPSAPLASTGRAYFGNYIEGSVNVTDYGVWNNASGTMANTLNHPLAKHIQRLNQIRKKIPALQKGQYSLDGCSGFIAFKKRFTDAAKGIDSFCLVTISGGATFSGIPNGTYVDAITGDTKVVSNGILSCSCSGQGNMRIYVLSLPGNPAPGKIGSDGTYLHP
ncbi:MAG: starch-binding protein [Brevinematales bacterium]|nr:starch-binding protein [Brevinematales bacterium]